jgi:hypothetical protein
MQLLEFFRRSVWALPLVLGASACAQPLMNLPQGLAGRADTYPVEGRHGVLLLEPQISFGPFRTVSIHRGPMEGEHSSQPTGLLSSEQHDSERQQFEFVLQGPGSRTWRVRCTDASESATETQAVGVHVGTDGAGIVSEETPISERAGYTCQLDGPGDEHWTLAADRRLWRGTVRDAAKGLVVEIKGVSEPGTWKHPALEGNTLVSPSGEVWAAVQRSFDGAVVLSRDLDPGRQAALAAICSALLIPGH